MDVRWAKGELGTSFEHLRKARNKEEILHVIMKD